MRKVLIVLSAILAVASLPWMRTRFTESATDSVNSEKVVKSLWMQCSSTSEELSDDWIKQPSLWDRVRLRWRCALMSVDTKKGTGVERGAGNSN
jgi:hypothetical protein